MTKEDFEKLENYFIEELSKDKSGFEITDGNKNFILSAPHSVPQLREGKPKKPEYRTGVMVVELGKRLNSPTIVKTKYMNDDANYNDVHIYRESLKKYVIKNNISFLMDFHLSRPDREYDIDVGTAYGKNLKGRDDILQFIVNGLKDNGYYTTVDFLYTGSGPNCVPADISNNTNAFGIMFEFNWRIIDSYEKTIKLIDILENIFRGLDI